MTARTCKGRCRYLGPPVKGEVRRGVIRGRCETCDTWVGRLDARLKDGSPARKSAADWYCDCCGERMELFPQDTTGGTCTGVCRKFKAGSHLGGRYAQGQVRCSTCGVWMNRDGVRLGGAGKATWRCVCCNANVKMRRAPRKKTKKAAP